MSSLELKHKYGQIVISVLFLAGCKVQMYLLKQIGDKMKNFTVFIIVIFLLVLTGCARHPQSDNTDETFKEIFGEIELDTNESVVQIPKEEGANASTWVEVRDIDTQNNVNVPNAVSTNAYTPSTMTNGESYSEKINQTTYLCDNENCTSRIYVPMKGRVSANINSLPLKNNLELRGINLIIEFTPKPNIESLKRITNEVPAQGHNKNTNGYTLKMSSLAIWERYGQNTIKILRSTISDLSTDIILSNDEVLQGKLVESLNSHLANSPILVKAITSNHERLITEIAVPIPVVTSLRY